MKLFQSRPNKAAFFFCNLNPISKGLLYFDSGNK